MASIKISARAMLKIFIGVRLSEAKKIHFYYENFFQFSH